MIRSFIYMHTKVNALCEDIFRMQHTQVTWLDNEGVMWYMKHKS